MARLSQLRMTSFTLDTMKPYMDYNGQLVKNHSAVRHIVLEHWWLQLP